MGNGKNIKKVGVSIPCGPYALAAACNLKMWERASNIRGHGGFYTTVGEMIHALTELEREPTYKRGGSNYTKLKIPDGYKEAIAFIQWGPHDRHWIYLKQTRKGLKVHCSVKGDFIAGARTPYKRSYIRSYLLLS